MYINNNSESCITEYILNTAHSTLHTAHFCTLHTAQWTLHTAHPAAYLPWPSYANSSLPITGTALAHWRTALHSSALHCTGCTALHCSALHCTELHFTKIQCNAMQGTALHCTALSTALYCTALHWTVMQCNAIQCKSMQKKSLQCNAIHQNCTAVFRCAVYGRQTYITCTLQPTTSTPGGARNTEI